MRSSAYCASGVPPKQSSRIFRGSSCGNHMIPAVALTLSSFPRRSLNHSLTILYRLSSTPAKLLSASCSQHIAAPASDAAAPLSFPPPSKCYSQSRFSSSSPPLISSLVIHLWGYLLHLWYQLPYATRHRPNPGHPFLSCLHDFFFRCARSHSVPRHTNPRRVRTQHA